MGTQDLAQSLWSCAALKLHSRLAQPLLAAAAGKCSELSVAGLPEPWPSLVRGHLGPIPMVLRGPV